jgi:hypothetical protein
MPDATHSGRLHGLLLFAALVPYPQPQITAIRRPGTPSLFISEHLSARPAQRAAASRAGAGIDRVAHR